jgi:hypothetical protein
MLHRNTVLLWEDILISESCFCSRHKELCLDFATNKKHLKSFGKHYWNCYCEFIDCKRKNKSNSNMIALTRFATAAIVFKSFFIEHKLSKETR